MFPQDLQSLPQERILEILFNLLVINLYQIKAQKYRISHEPNRRSGPFSIVGFDEVDDRRDDFEVVLVGVIFGGDGVEDVGG